MRPRARAPTQGTPGAARHGRARLKSSTEWLTVRSAYRSAEQADPDDEREQRAIEGGDRGDQGGTERIGERGKDANAEAAAALFDDPATYRSYIFQEPYEGPVGVRRYWQEVTAPQSRVSMRMGRPFVNGNRVAAEF
jgi:SnoaL-like domain